MVNPEKEEAEKTKSAGCCRAFNINLVAVYARGARTTALFVDECGRCRSRCHNQTAFLALDDVDYGDKFTLPGHQLAFWSAIQRGVEWSDKRRWIEPGMATAQRAGDAEQSASPG